MVGAKLVTAGVGVYRPDKQGQEARMIYVMMD